MHVLMCLLLPQIQNADVLISNYFLKISAIDIVARVNLAKGKPTRQSSIAAGNDASKAVDGDTSTEISCGSCSVTQSETDAWWAVDLQSQAYIERVALTNSDNIRKFVHCAIFTLVSPLPW